MNLRQVQKQNIRKEKRASVKALFAISPAGTKKTQAVAYVSMWCNRMLVNGSTANFEQSHNCTVDPIDQYDFC